MATKAREQNTRFALIESAERMIAERGMGNVSHRDIAFATGQRNVSVINYHFGGLDNLIMAVLEHRMATVDLRRKQLWSCIQDGTVPGTLIELARTFILPLQEYIEQAEGTSYYARFLVQLDADPRTSAWEFTDSVLSGKPLTGHWLAAESVKEIIDAIRTELHGKLRPEILELRLQLAYRLITQALAEREKLLHQHRAGSSPLPLDGAVFQQALIDSYLNVLTGRDSTSHR